MKAKWIKSGCIMLGMALLTAGCGKEAPPSAENSDPPAAVSEKPMPQVSQAPEAETTYDDSLLECAISEKGTFRDEFDQDWSYRYQVPRLLDDTPAAEKINQAILEEQGGAVEECMEAMEQENTPPFCGTISWESFWNGSLLSLVISRSYNFYSETEYQVFNYDFATGEALDTAQLLKRQGVSEDAFFLALRRAAAAEHDGENHFLYDQFGNCFDAVAHMRAQTISSVNLAPDKVPVFLNGDGALTAVICRAVYAGGGVIRELIVPQLTPEKGANKTVRFEFLSATLANNQVTITYHKTEDSDWYIPAEGVEYEVPYQVEGLYGTYTDMAIGIIGQNMLPHLFLLDTEGRVTFCDVMGCGFQSAPRYFAVGPLPGIEGALSFEAKSFSDGQTMYVRTADGQQLDLAEFTIPAAAVRHPLLTPDCLWASGDGLCTLELTADGTQQVLTWGGGVTHELSQGSLSYGGMTEDGMQFPFFLWTQAGDHVGGLLTMECFTPFSGVEGDNKLTMTQLTGPLLPGMPESGTIELVRLPG